VKRAWGRRALASSESSEALAGRTAVVTGGAASIGLAIAEALAAAGARVVILDRDADALERVTRRIDGRAVQGDMARDDPVDLAERVLEQHGTVELIVNNVGVTTEASFRELERDDFDRVFATNLRGPWFFTRRLVESVLADRRRASIVFISSLHSSRVRHFPHYSASKAGVAMLVKELARELGPSGIRVNSVSPGWIDRRWADKPGRVGSQLALGRAGRPEDVAPVALALLDDRIAGYVTGADLVVDGGLSLYSWLDAAR
jgi:3-oxoacyl-[acyl-carrier protein] reductase